MSFQGVTYRFGLAVTLVTVFFVGNSQALDIIAETGFNDSLGINASGTAGEPYLDTQALIGTTAGTGEAGWTTLWTRVGNNGISETIQSSTLFEGDLALQLQSGSGSNASVVRREFAPVSLGEAGFSVRVNVDSFGGQNQTLYLRDADGGQAILITLQPDGSVEARNGGSNDTILAAGTILEDTWHQFEATANIDTQTYTVMVDGSPIAGTFDFRNETTEIDAFQIWNKSSSAFYDELQVLGNTSIGPTEVTVDRSTGSILLRNNTGSDVEIVGYSMTSANGALDQSNWIPIKGNYDDSPGGDGSIDPDDQWTILTASGVTTDLSEAQFGGTPGDGGALANDVDYDLGEAWIQNPEEDIEFQLLLSNGDVQDVDVSFVGGSGSAYERSDLDFDNDIDEADFVLYNAGLFTNLTGLSSAQAYQQGDLDNDGDNDFDDFDTFKADFVAENGPGSFEAMISRVPEPSSAALLLLGTLGLFWSSFRGSLQRSSHRSVGVIFVLALSLASTNSAQAIEMFAETGFNDATGINGDAVVDGSPHLDTEDLEGAGAGETGWANPWVRTTNNGSATIQSGTVFEGDLALEANSAAGGGASVFKREAAREITGGIAQADYYFNINDRSNGENGSFYLQHIDGKQAALVTLQTDGAIDARDGSINGGPNSDVELFAPGSIVDDTWYKLSIIADVDTQTFQVALDDVLASGTLNFRSDLIAENVGLNAVQFWNKTDSFLVDAITLSATPLDELEQIEVAVNRSNGKMQLANKWSSAFSWDYYKISSAGDSLDSVAWNSLEEQGYDETGAGPGEGWVEAGGSGSGLLAETFLGASTLAPGEIVAMGEGYDESVDAQDLVFQYRDTASGRVLYANVNYVELGDMNGDGVVSDLDVNPFVQALTDRAAYDSAFPGVNADFVGDFNDNGQLDLGDIAGFKLAVPGVGAGNSNAVPEPAAATLLLMLTIGAAFRRRGVLC